MADFVLEHPCMWSDGRLVMDPASGVTVFDFLIAAGELSHIHSWCSNT